MDKLIADYLQAATVKIVLSVYCPLRDKFNEYSNLCRHVIFMPHKKTLKSCLNTPREKTNYIDASE